MTILNVIDSNTGKIIAVDLSNPTGTIFVNDANTGDPVPVPLSVATLSSYQNTLVVDQGGAGDFSTIEDAVNSISDASSSKRYGIIVMPGNYSPASQIVLKNCVDIIGLIPRTVKVTSSTGFTTIGLFNCDTAISDGFSLKGIDIDYSRTNKIAIAIYTNGACNNVIIEDCIIRCTASSGSICMALDFGNVSSGRSYVKNCVIETTNSTPIRATFGWSGSSTGELIVSDCLIQVARTASGSMAVECDGTGLRIHRCLIRGGENCIGDAGNSTSCAVSHCEMTAGFSGLVTNTIGTPYNVVDSDV